MPFGHWLTMHNRKVLISFLWKMKKTVKTLIVFFFPIKTFFNWILNQGTRQYNPIFHCILIITATYHLCFDLCPPLTVYIELSHNKMCRIKVGKEEKNKRKERKKKQYLMPQWLFNFPPPNKKHMTFGVGKHTNFNQDKP